jgi:hypothetical protein
MIFNSERYRITCCKDCPDRCPGCHGKCEKYIQQRAEYDAMKEKMQGEYYTAYGLAEQRVNGIHRATKHRNYRSKYRKDR